MGLAAAVCVIILILGAVLATSMGLVGACTSKPDACTADYRPVYGIPTLRLHTNSCNACAEGAWLWLIAPAQSS